MNAVFADTSFFVAFLNPADSFHTTAIKQMAILRPIITTSWILLELGNYVCDSPQRRLFAPFIQELKGDATIQIIPSEEELFQAGLELYNDRLDKGWSLTDCISFVVMSRFGLTDALTADRHFLQAGFNTLL